MIPTPVMTWGWYKYYAILSFMALIAVWITQLAVLLIFVFGIGLILLLTPSLWLYVTVALPGIFLWRKLGKPFLGLALSSICMLMLAVLPPHYASLNAARLIDDAIADDFVHLGKIDYADQQIILVDKVETLRAPALRTSDNNVPCSRVCQRLLLEGLGGPRGVFVAIREPVSGYRSNPFQIKGSFYRIETRNYCPQSYTRSESEVFAETYQLSAQRKCIIRYPSSSIPDGYLFDEQVTKKASFIPKTELAYPIREKRLEVYKTAAGQKKLLARSTSIRVRKALFPTLIIPAASLMHSVTALPYYSGFTEKDNPDLVELLEMTSGRILKKRKDRRRSPNESFETHYFELGKSKHQLPKDFREFFTILPDESFLAP